MQANYENGRDVGAAGEMETHQWRVAQTETGKGAMDTRDDVESQGGDETRNSRCSDRGLITVRMGSPG